MMKLHRLLIVALTLALPVAVFAGSYTWTDTSGDHQWTNAANWTPATGYPVTTADDAVFHTNKTGSVNIGANTSIRYLYISQPRGTNIYDIAAGKTLSARYLQASAINVTNRATIRGGTFKPYQQMDVARKYTESAFPEAHLTLTNTVCDTADLTALYIGVNTHHIREIYGTVNASQAQIRFGAATNSLTVAALSVGQNRGIGRLDLPPAVTNIHATTFYLGTWHNVDIAYWPALDRTSWIDLGQNPKLDQIRVKTHLQVGRGNFRYRDAGGTPRIGLPPNLELRIGEPANRAIFRLGYIYNTPVDVRWSGFRRFEGHFSELTIGYCENATTNYAMLDLTATNTLSLAGDFTAYDFNTPALKLGGLRSGVGVLKLPGTVTNLALNSLIMGEMNDLTGPPTYSILHLGSNAQVRTVMVRDTFRLGLGKFKYVDAGGTEREGFPGGVDFRAGTPDRRAEFLVGAANGLNTVVLFGAGIERFEGWLSSFTVSKRNDSWANHYVTSTLDLRGAEVAAMNITGAANIGHSQGALSTVYLPPCAMRCSNLTIGRAGISNSTHDVKWVGHMYISNTVVTVTNQAAIKQTGRLFATLNGQSCGIDLATNNLTVDGTNPVSRVHGRIALTFADDPVSQTDDYFGLRLKGNAVAALQALHAASPSRLTWSISGLSARNQARFGIHYDATRNLTVVGLLRLPGGTTLMVR
jgi:hypothetical protein